MTQLPPLIKGCCPEGKRRVLLTVSYDGTAYAGWQRQQNALAVQQVLEEALRKLTGEKTLTVTGSSRTDAGVHARRQVCSFRAETDMGCAELLARLRQYLPEDIGALSLEEAPPRFHARLSCTEKSYLYRIWNSGAPNVFERKYLYRYPGALDTDAKRRAAHALIGEHDFTAFCSNRHMKKSAVRTLRSIEIDRHGDELRILLTGNGFLYNMVRIIVGTLIEAGRGERDADNIAAALQSRDRKNAGFTSPAQGLCLWDVRY